MNTFFEKHPTPWKIEETPLSPDGCNILDAHGALVDYDVEKEYAASIVNAINVAFEFMKLCAGAPPIKLMEQLGELNMKARRTLTTFN